MKKIKQEKEMVEKNTQVFKSKKKWRSRWKIRRTIFEKKNAEVKRKNKIIYQIEDKDKNKSKKKNKKRKKKNEEK